MSPIGKEVDRQTDYINGVVDKVRLGYIFPIRETIKRIYMQRLKYIGYIILSV